MSRGTRSAAAPHRRRMKCQITADEVSDYGGIRMHEVDAVIGEEVLSLIHI